MSDESVNTGSAGKIVLGGRGLRKSYQIGTEELVVLRDISIEIAEGESVSIQGASGCGKTTLLNVLSGLETADAGELHWNGALIRGPGDTATTRARARHIGLVFQSYYLVPELFVLENVALAGRIGGMDSGESKRRARELLEGVGLAGYDRRIPDRLSGGERQRVAVARALMNRPKVLMADEPTGNLDVRSAETVMELLLRQCVVENTALLLVTHNPDYARLAQRQLVLEAGVLSN